MSAKRLSPSLSDNCPDLSHTAKPDEIHEDPIFGSMAVIGSGPAKQCDA